MNFLYPPRPEKAILPQMIPVFENRGWIAQLKKNGTCSLAFVDAEGNVTFKTRHDEDHKAWTPTSEAINFFLRYPNSVFIFELLHSKGGDVRNHVYIFDVIKFNGQDLVGWTLENRLRLLQEIKPRSTQIEIAGVYRKNLKALYDGLTNVLDEGIVLKDPKAKLLPCFRNGLNAGWQVKCRKATKNYGF
jgi:hypothetical protein